MSSSDTEALLRRNYQAYAEKDVAVIDELAGDDMVMHVPGRHPLAGDHVGREAAWAYLGRIAEVSGGTGGFNITSLTVDDQGHGAVILTATIRDFVRTVVHVWRVEEGHLAEYWEINFDQPSEDDFWNGALASQ